MKIIYIFESMNKWIKKPYLLLNTSIAKQNIQKINALCREKQMDFRPHFKTHQSAKIGDWFKKAGVNKCAVSSIGMAQYFVQAGWRDICIAIPFNINELEEVEQLSKEAKLSLCVDHLDTIKALQSTTSKVSIFIEIDSGYGRSGVFFSDTSAIDSLIDEIRNNDRLSFKGFLSHTGNSYYSMSPVESRQVFAEARLKLVQLKQRYSINYPYLLISMGDTPSSTFGSAFDGIGEWRPGNFVFYDFMQYAMDCCKETEIALSLFCPVIGIYPKREEIAIYGGGVHLSKESIVYKGQKIYGWLRPENRRIESGFPVVSLSQEHGIIRANIDYLSSINIGDFVEIIPVHSCMTADLNSNYISSHGEKISKFRTFS
jgi:D-serine deaminase-like pyridoxal phosphate-dependent protein